MFAVIFMHSWSTPTPTPHPHPRIALKFSTVFGTLWVSQRPVMKRHFSAFVWFWNTLQSL